MSASLGDPVRDSPYQGLEPFYESDAAFFFGRERETKLIIASMFASSLTLLYGASGVGKSSVLRAGVLPRLLERPDLLPIVFPVLLNEPRSKSASLLARGWQDDPLGGIKETVAAALLNVAGKRLSASAREFFSASRMRPLREFLAACHEFSGRRLMVVLDQFEEYSLYHPEDDPFAEQFPSAITPGDLSVSFLVALREDALAKLDRFKGKIPTLWDSYRRIDHLSHAAAEEAIRLPLREYHRQHPNDPSFGIEDELVHTVLREVQTESVVFEATGGGRIAPPTGSDARIETPYLQLVMTRLWEREQADRSTHLRLRTLYDEGGAAEIVKTHLDRVMEQFTVDERDVAAQVFHRLVTPSGAKIAFSVRDLSEYEGVEPDRLAPILRRLEEGSRRILRRVAARAGAAGEPRYEIFHDRLGKAILSWRAKRIQEQEREHSQRLEAEQLRFAEESGATYRNLVDSAMHELGLLKAIWAAMMFYLVSTDGTRFARTARELAELSEQSEGDVNEVTKRLSEARILKRVLESADSAEAIYRVRNDGTARALSKWHSQYVKSRTQSLPGRPRPAPVHPPAEPRKREFPYHKMRDLLENGRVIPFLGVGVSVSAHAEGAVGIGATDSVLPSNAALKELLTRRCGLTATQVEPSTLAEVASYYADIAGRESLDEWLDQTLGSMDHTPSATHRLIAEVAKSTPLLILTTNYDTLMEQALDAIGARYHTLAYLSARHRRFALFRYGTSEPQFILGRDLKFELEMHRLRTTCLMRLNGPAIKAGTRIGPYIITEEDQIRWPSALNPGEWPFHMDKLLLFLGHPLIDWFQRMLLHTVHGICARQSGAVILRSAPLSLLTWRAYGIETWEVDLNEWAMKMQQKDPNYQRNEGSPGSPVG